VASDFDEQTLSAVAWLNSNDVDISCFKLIPYKINGEVYIQKEKILPITDYSEYYVNLMDKSMSTAGNITGRKTGITRQTLPKIDMMLEWGVVKQGDIIVAKGRDDEAPLLSNGNVMVNGVEKSLQEWLKEVYGWASVQTYAFAVHKESGKTLAQIRAEYMDQEKEQMSDE